MALDIRSLPQLTDRPPVTVRPNGPAHAYEAKKLPKDALTDVVAPFRGKRTRKGEDSMLVARAVIWAESKGKTNARNRNVDGSVDRGLWQINSRWHPEVSDACADNPVCATGAAVRISHGGTDFSAWSTYNSGAYKDFMDDDFTPDADSAGPFGIGSGKAWDEPSDVTDALGVDGFLSRLQVIFEAAFWRRVLFILAGAALLGLAFVMFARDFGSSTIGRALH